MSEPVLPSGVGRRRILARREKLRSSGGPGPAPEAAAQDDRVRTGEHGPGSEAGGAPCPQPAEAQRAAGEATSHQEELDAALGMVRTAVELEMRCDFGGAGPGDTSPRPALLAHFGGLARAFGGWDAAVARAAVAPGALWERLAASVVDRGITEPPVAVGSLVDRLALTTLERSRRGLLGAPHELYFQRLPARVKGTDVMTLYVEGQPVATVADANRAGAELELDIIARVIQAMFDEAQRCSEALEVDHAHDSLLILKQDLLQSIESCAAKLPVALGDECPACRAIRARYAGR